MRASPQIFSAFALLVLAGSARATIVATSVDDICEPADNPCVIDEVVELADGHTFDFGERTLRIEGDGVLDFGAAVSHVRCGKLEVDVPDGAVAIRANAEYADEDAWVQRRVEVVRQCSDKPRDCASEHDCDLGECNVRVCTLDPSRQCFHEEGCDFGECRDDHTCNYAYPKRACSSNSDCQVGPCSSQLYCQGSKEFSLPFHLNDGLAACSSNADCSYGDCSVGDGTADLGGAMHLEVPYPYYFLLFAAGDLEIRKPVEIVGRGGDTAFVSGVGNVEAKALVRTSGADGGSIYFRTEAGDVLVDAPIEGDGESSAGSVGLHAAGSVLVHADVTARTTQKRSDGGWISIISGDDFRIGGGTGSDLVEIHAGFAEALPAGEPDGPGGFVSILAGRDAYVDEFSSLRADGHEANVFVFAENDTLVAGDVFAATYGAGRIGPALSLAATRDLSIGSTSKLEIRAGDGARAGSLSVGAGRDVDLDASIRFDGALREEPWGYFAPWIDIRGCMIRIGPDAHVVNTAVQSRNRFEARGGIRVEGGASLACEDGPNIARVRSEENPLEVSGSFDPPLVVAESPNLDPCPNCIHPETGDREFCDDGLGCTRDVCTNGLCGVEPDDSICSDGEYCNGTEVCDTSAGCVHGDAIDCSFLDGSCLAGICEESLQSCIQVVDDGGACEDGDDCTHSDACNADVCKGIRDVACGDCGSDTIEWGEDCDDGDDAFAFGDECRADCQWTGCGHPTGSNGASPTTADALYVLRTAVELSSCALVVCDANDSSSIETIDALLVLRAAVGLPVGLCSSVD